jgi:hypothetical protein
MYYIYVYLDTRKKGSYSYGEFHFDYEPFYVGKGINDRYLSHLRIAKGSRKGKNNRVISKIKSILNDCFEPIILKVIENLSKIDYSSYEILTIKTIGKSCDGLGPLLNTTDGGDGGITWIGEHHNKGKKLEEIVGEEKSVKLKQKLSEQASKRVGELNSNYGNKGELNPIFGTKRSQETIDKIRKNTLKQFSNYSKEEINFIVERMNDGRRNIPEDIKQEWYNKISNSLKEKSEKDELFSDEHKQKLKDTNYKKLNKGSDKLKLSDETKKKISNSLKNRVFTSEHRENLRKCISFEEFEIIIVYLVNNGLIKTITAYRKYAKDNPDLRYPLRPEKSYRNCGWTDWRKYEL